MPPKKRSSSRNTRANPKRPRVSEMTETQAGQADQTDQMMSVNIQALSASISVAVKQAVQEALAGTLRTRSQDDTASSREQLANRAIETSLENITQGTQPILSRDAIVLNPSPGTPQAPKQLFASVAVPLGSRVSSKVKAKIWAHEYIDYGSLLILNPTNQKYALSVSSSGGEFTQPQLTLEPSHTAKKVQSLNQWLSAFSIFVAIYSEKFAQETPKLMKYCEIVRDIAAKPGDWQFYDEQFRYIRQSAPEQFPWDAVHWELWLKAVTNFRPKTNVTSDKSSTRSRTRQSFPKGTCWAFHGGRVCNGCRYEHICYKCGSKHPAPQCPAIGQQRGPPPKAGPSSPVQYQSSQAGHTRKGGSS